MSYPRIRALLTALSTSHPVLLIIEDLHWADSESLAAIQYNLADLPAGVVLFLAFRSEFVAPWLNDHPELDHLSLQPLALPESRELAARLLGQPDDKAGLVDFVSERAGGNPFFAEEIVADLAEQGFITGKRLAYEMRSTPPPRRVPISIRALIAARTDRLQPEEKGLIESAAVVGPEFDRGLLAAVELRSEAAIRPMLLRLVEGGFLKLATNGLFTFRHALIHEVAYLGIPLFRRRALHHAVYNALAARHRTTPYQHAEELLHHATEAERWPEAARHARQAGAKALSLSANRQARAFLAEGLGALGHMPEGRERDELAVDIRLDMREALFKLGMLPEVVTRLREAALIADSLGDRPRRGQLMIQLSHILWLTGAHAAAGEVAERAINLGHEWQDQALNVRAVFQLGLSQLAIGQFQAAAMSMERTIAAIRSKPAILGKYGLDMALDALARSYAARAYADLGSWEEASAAVADSEKTAEAVNKPFSRVFAKLAAAYVSVSQGQSGPALDAAKAAIRLCAEAEASLLLPVALALLGAAHLSSGSVAAALDPLRSAVTSAGTMGFLFQQPSRLSLLAEAELRSGLPGEAVRSAQRAARLARRLGDLPGQAHAFRTMGLISGSLGKWERANREYTRAASLAASMHMRPLADRTCVELSALMIQQAGRVARAPVAAGA